MKILMVCLGNICRSPIAEGILKYKAKRAGLNWEIDSAGTNGIHNGEKPHLLSQKICALNGIDISNQISRKLNKNDLEKFDLIYAMSNDVLEEVKQIAGSKYNDNKVSLFLETLYPGCFLDIPDPWYGKEDMYIKVFDLINQTCDKIIENHLNPLKSV
jgi:protein-tyrosine phosphatase